MKQCSLGKMRYVIKYTEDLPAFVLPSQIQQECKSKLCVLCIEKQFAPIREQISAATPPFSGAENSVWTEGITIAKVMCVKTRTY